MITQWKLSYSRENAEANKPVSKLALSKLLHMYIKTKVDIMSRLFKRRLTQTVFYINDTVIWLPYLFIMGCFWENKFLVKK